MSRNLLAGVVGAAGLVVCGCGGDGKIPLAPVVGTVTYKGKPVAGAAISFIPETPGVRAGVGRTDKDGRYVIETYEPADGGPVGRCKVAISLRGPPKRLKPGLGEAAAEELLESGDPLIPTRYFDPDKSGLAYEIVKGRTNTFDIVLTD
jgi:hypothetical protein